MQEDEPNQNLRKCLPLMSTTKQGEGFEKRDDNGNLHTVAHERENRGEKNFESEKTNLLAGINMILS